MLRKTLFLHFVIVSLPDVVGSSLAVVYANMLPSWCVFRLPDGHACSTPQLPGHDGSSADSEPIAGGLSGRNGQSDSEHDGAVSHYASVSGIRVLHFARILMFLHFSMILMRWRVCLSGVCAAGFSKCSSGSLSATDLLSGPDQSDASALHQHAGVLQHDAADATL